MLGMKITSKMFLRHKKYVSNDQKTNCDAHTPRNYSLDLRSDQSAAQPTKGDPGSISADQILVVVLGRNHLET